MKSFFRGVVQRDKVVGIVGKTLKIGPYTVRIDSHIADGGFASIYKVRDNSTSAVYALKHMRLVGDREAIADCMTEVETMKRLRGQPGILTLRAVAFQGGVGAEQEAYLLLDLCQDNLVEFMAKQDNKLNTATIVQIFSAVCQGVAAMHRQNPPLAHRFSLLQHSLALASAHVWVDL